jgi:hypothetical protein
MKSQELTADQSDEPGTIGDWGAPVVSGATEPEGASVLSEPEEPEFVGRDSAVDVPSEPQAESSTITEAARAVSVLDIGGP